MASSCVTFPTSTRTDQLVTQTPSTTVSDSVSIVPPVTETTTISVSCSAGPSGTCTGDTVLSVTVIPGFTTTIAVPVTTFVQVTESLTTTLFGSSCSAIDDNNNNTPTSPPFTPPTSTPTSTSTTPVFTPTSTDQFIPPAAVYTSASTTTSNGSVVIQYTTVTATQPPRQSQSATGAAAHKTSSANVGAIAGGVAGGFVGLIAIVLLIWFIIRRRRRWDDIFDNEDKFAATTVGRLTRPPRDPVPEPKPYQYGALGQSGSPPGSPPPGADFRPEHGYNRNSLTPLMASNMSAGSSSVTVPTIAGSANGRPPQNLMATSGHSHSLSATSLTSTPGSHGGWAGQSPNATPGVTPGVMPGVAMVPAGGHEDPAYFNRAGSPVSVHEQRILQVANARPVSVEPDAFEHVSVPIVAPEPRLDGKGRLSTIGEKAPIVHLDGGRYQQQDLGAGSSSSGPVMAARVTPAPPAYTE